MLFARASLKPLTYSLTFSLLRCYPVLFARASLKPHHQYPVESGGVVTPCFLRGPH